MPKSLWATKTFENSYQRHYGAFCFLGAHLVASQYKSQGIDVILKNCFFLLLDQRWCKYTILLWKLRLIASNEALNFIMIKLIFYNPVLASWKFAANFQAITSTIFKLQHTISFHIKQKGLNILILCKKKVQKMNHKACFVCNSVNFQVICFLFFEIMKFEKVLKHKVEKSRTSKVVFTNKWIYMKPLNSEYCLRESLSVAFSRFLLRVI